MRGIPTPLNSLGYFFGLDKVFPQSKTWGGYRLTYIDKSKTNKVGAVSGAFMMMRRDMFFAIDGFDEDYFMYGEDIDLCYRVGRMGKDIVCYAGASMLHLKGQSGLHTNNPTVLYHFYHSMDIFYEKHFKKKYGPLVSFFVKRANAVRYYLALKRLDSQK
jgi:GT2 family glycosyltransferase